MASYVVIDRHVVRPDTKNFPLFLKDSAFVLLACLSTIFPFETRVEIMAINQNRHVSVKSRRLGYSTRGLTDLGIETVFGFTSHPPLSPVNNVDNVFKLEPWSNKNTQKSQRGIEEGIGEDSGKGGAHVRGKLRVFFYWPVLEDRTRVVVGEAGKYFRACQSSTC